MPASLASQALETPGGPRRRGRLRDPRVWIGIWITLLALWYAFRDVDPESLLQEFRRANLVVLHRDPARALRWASILLRPFPTRLRSLLLGEIHGFSQGLGALSGGSHLFWIGLHTLLIWLVASTLPILAGFLALGVDLGSAKRTLMVSWMTLAAIGIAVALPSAPGFFGVYHSACRLVLERFGIPVEMALAHGTLFHAVFWFSLTGLGLVVLRSRVTSLAEVDRAAGG